MVSYGYMRRSPLARFLALAAAGAVAFAPAAALASKLEIDRIVEDDVATKGELVIFADILDDNGLVIKDQDPNDIHFYFDDVEVPGTVQVKTFKEANQQLNIALLLAAHQGYAVPIVDTATVLAQEKAGFVNFLKNLSDQDRVAAWFYNEKGITPVQSWSTTQLQTAGNVDSLVKPPEGSEGDKATAAPLYTSIERVLNAMKEDEANQPGRRVLVLMSDGLDTNTQAKPAAVDAKIKTIAEAALSQKVKIYGIGYTADIPEPLVKLSGLATATNGVWKKLEKFDTIPDDIAGISNELKNQYVITFKPTDYSGSDKPVTVRMELKAKNGANLKRVATDTIKWPSVSKLPQILMIVGIAVGSLLGLFLIFLLIKKIAKSRKNRPQAVVEEEAYAGPYKGKLACMTGQYAGRDFFLTEDVTTIGSIAGNTIVLVEAGVSKRHAGIKIEDMRFELADFGSTNGTHVNGAKITKQFLKDGDEVRIGEAKMRFSLK